MEETQRHLIEKLYDELTNFKQQREDLKREIHDIRGDGKKEHKEFKKMLNTRNKDKRNYNEVMKENKNKRKIILVKVKTQQNSEDTEKLLTKK